MHTGMLETLILITACELNWHASCELLTSTAVIEALDIMKKNRESYSARDVIKFLEKELHTGNKYLQAQKPSESRLPEKKRSAKTDMQVW